MRLTNKLLAALSVFFIAAADQGTFEIVRSSAPSELVTVVVLLTTVTSFTFILILLACGLREPLI